VLDPVVWFSLQKYRYLILSERFFRKNEVEKNDLFLSDLWSTISGDTFHPEHAINLNRMPEHSFQADSSPICLALSKLLQPILRPG
jgi:hypothetical protein